MVKNYQKILGTALTAGIVSINLAGYLGAYSSTNYRLGHQKLGYPRPENTKTPQNLQLAFSTEVLSINQQEWIESWLIPSPRQSQGIVILFHGKDSTKSSLLSSAHSFHRLGYTTLLVDFRGSGGSSGNSTTVGVRESQDVALITNYVKQQYPQQPIILYGISMGSAAILRAIAKEKIEPEGIILELPFTSLLSAVKKRLNQSNLPAFPLGELMVFWGGIQHNFNGFAHQPIDYAQKVNCPTLILYGAMDNTINTSEVKNLYDNIPGNKKIIEFPQAGHQLLVSANPQLWQYNVAEFLSINSEP